MSLKNKTIVLTRQKGDNDELMKKLTKLGATVYELPMIHIMGRELNDAELAMLAKTYSYDWIVFKSAHSVSFFCKKLRELRILIDAVSFPKVAAVGRVTASTAESYGISCQVVPEDFTSADLAGALKKNTALKNKKILIPRGNLASDEFIYDLRARGAEVTTVTLYDTVLASQLDDIFMSLLRDDKIDALTFASPSAVSGFSEAMKKLSNDDILFEKALLLPIVCIGPRTASSASNVGFRNIHTASPFTSDGIVEALLSVVATH